MCGKQRLLVMVAELASFNQTRLFWMVLRPWTFSKGSEAFGGKEEKGGKKTKATKSALLNNTATSGDWWDYSAVIKLLGFMAVHIWRLGITVSSLSR